MTTAQMPHEETKHFRMSELFFQYAVLALELDSVLHSLDINCPTHCGSPRGCCNGDFYIKGSTPEMQNYQNLEGRPQTEDVQKCKYHTDGCTLTIKPPLCITFLCTDAEDYLKQKYGPEGDEFADAMADACDAWPSMRTKDNGRSLIERMIKAIIAGQKIIRRKAAR